MRARGKESERRKRMRARDIEKRRKRERMTAKDSTKCGEIEEVGRW